MLTVLKILLLLLPLTAEAGRVEANAQLQDTPVVYTIVAVPENWKTDPVSQDLVNGFKQDPTLVALRKSTKMYSYTAANPDWKHRWAARVPQLPTVIVMENDKVLYKRSGVGAKPIIEDCSRNGILQRIRICPDGTCPDGPYNPNQPNQPYTPPNTVIVDTPNNPNSPLQPSPVGPQIPDTPVVPYTPPQLPPQQPPVVATPPIDLTPIAEGQTNIVNELKVTNDVQQKVLVAIQQMQPPSMEGVEQRLDVIATAQVNIQNSINDLVAPAPLPIPPQPAPKQPLVYVTSKNWCKECDQVTAKVEQVRSTGLNIAIVELDGFFTNPPRSFKSTGIPAIHDFNTNHSIVGAEACMAFLSNLEKE